MNLVLRRPIEMTTARTITFVFDGKEMVAHVVLDGTAYVAHVAETHQQGDPNVDKLRLSWRVLEIGRLVSDEELVKLLEEELIAEAEDEALDSNGGGR